MPCWWGLTRLKQLSMAATARVIWLCACVRYWPDRGLVFECVTCFYCRFKKIQQRLKSGKLRQGVQSAITFWATIELNLKLRKWTKTCTKARGVSLEFVKFKTSTDDIFCDSVVAAAVTVPAIVRTRPRVIPLAMITMKKKSTHWFPFLSHMSMWLRLAALRAAGAPL